MKKDYFFFLHCFLIFAQNIDCGFTLEPAQLAQNIEAVLTSIEYPCIPQFCYIKVGLKGLHISRTCFPDGMSVG